MPPVIRINGTLHKLGEDSLTPSDTEEFAKQILGEFYDEYRRTGEFDTSYSAKGVGRFRVNVFKQRNSTALAIRVITLKIPTLDELKHPEILRELTKKKEV